MTKQFLKPPLDDFANTTMQWKSGDNENTWKKAKKNKEFPPSYGPEDVDYKHNSHGFRCDEFTDWSKHPYRILFAGCSFTEGIGVPLEDTWAKLFHTMLCQRLKVDIPYWNIGQGGAGLDHMVRYLYHVGDIIRPQIIISYLPFTERRERWHKDFWLPNQGKGNYFEDNFIKSDTILYKQDYIDYQTEKNFAMINLLLERWDTQMYCCAIDASYDCSYMNFPRIRQDRDLYLVKNDWARDGSHAGPKSNKVFAEKFFKKTWPYIELELRDK